METIWIYMALLTLAALAFVLVPLQRQSKVADATDLARRKEKNIEVFRQRQSELDEEFANNQWGREEYDKLCTELKRSFLADMEELESVSVNQRGGGRLQTRKSLPVLIALCIPVLAFWMYMDYGAGPDLAAPRLMNAIQNAETEAEQEAALLDLADFLQARLDRNVDDVQSGYMLGTLYLSMEEYENAVQTFRRIVDRTETDQDRAAILGQLVQAQYLQADQSITPEVQATIDRTLALNRNEQAVMSVLAIEAFVAGDVGEALNYWRRQLGQLEPGSRDAQRLQQRINQVQAMLPQEEEVTSTEAGADEAVAVTVRVDVTPEIREQVDSSMRVFVFARRPEMPAPLAAQTFTVGDLPLEVTLDDSMAMMPQMTLSSADRVLVGARISRSGQAIAQSGDFQAISEAFELSEQSGPVELVISEIVP